MLNHQAVRLRFLRGAGKRPQRRFRRGVYILPSLFTLGNMFCGYACIVYSTLGDFKTAAPYIGFAMVLDMLDGRIARLTGAESQFGLQFDSLADVISFGVAPAILALQWGLLPLGPIGWAAGFLFVTAAAMRLARFNIQTAAGADKRYFVGMPSPPAAAVPAATVYAYPDGIQDQWQALPVLVMMLLPAVLMVSRVKFYSFKTIDLQSPRPYRVLLFIAAFISIMLVEWLRRYVLVALAYTYLASPFVAMMLTQVRHRGDRVSPRPAGDVATKTDPARDAALRN